MKRILFLVVAITAVLQLSAQQQLRSSRAKDDLLNEQYSTGMFNTRDAIFFDMLEPANANSSVAYFNILDWLQGRVAGLQIFKTRTQTSIPVIRNSLAAVFIDEIRMDYEILNVIPPSDIAMIKVIKGPFAGAMNAPGGAIIIYTKDGEEEESEE